MGHMSAFPVPVWVPDVARRYLAHTEAGRSIRDLAREAGCHASTVLRQIRRMETRRDDPLVDAALTRLARLTTGHSPDAKNQTQTFGFSKEYVHMKMTTMPDPNAMKAEKLEAEAARILRRLCETGAVLAVAEDMDKAVVVRDSEGQSARTAVVDVEIAQAMALKDWIGCSNPGRISRYRITATGRSELSRMLADAENQARNMTENGFAEAQTPFEAQPKDEVAGRLRRSRYSSVESPLAALSRRKDRDGKPFLDDSLVRAGERLREDFELAQLGPNVTQNWDRFLTGGSPRDYSDRAGTGPQGARMRVERALAELGPGLSDVALRCCCYMEGLETAEKRMGWSARSGKIVLRIALLRLKRHYSGGDAQAQMIG